MHRFSRPSRIVVAVAAKIAALRDEVPAVVARRAGANARALFGLPVPDGR
jgi:hypothetical protein